MAKRNGGTDIDALALCHCVRCRIQRRSRRGNPPPRRFGVAICFRANPGVLGVCRCTETLQKTLLRLRQFCLLRLRDRRTYLSVPDSGAASVSHSVLLRWRLGRCDVVRFCSIPHSRVCVVMATTSFALVSILARTLQALSASVHSRELTGQ